MNSNIIDFNKYKKDKTKLVNCYFEFKNIENNSWWFRTKLITKNNIIYGEWKEIK